MEPVFSILQGSKHLLLKGLCMLKASICKEKQSKDIPYKSMSHTCHEQWIEKEKMLCLRVSSFFL